MRKDTTSERRHLVLFNEFRALHTDLLIKHALVKDHNLSQQKRLQVQAKELQKNQNFFEWFKLQPEHAEIGARWASHKNSEHVRN